MTYKIEHNVPPPARTREGRLVSPERVILQTLAIGDSFLVELSRQKALYNAVQAEQKTSAKRFATQARIEGDKTRCWRIT